MEISEVLNKLKNVKKVGNEYTSECPICHDSHHLYITEKDGMVLLFCHKCGAEFKEIIPLLNISKDNSGKLIEVTEKYDHIYKNPDGSIAYYKTRTKYRDGKKKFLFWHRDEKNIKYFKPENCNALYNLDLLENADKSETLYIVEGEKCADIMVKNGLIATTSNTGGGNVKIKFSTIDKSMLDSFKNKVIIPDNDEIGFEYASKFPDAKILNLSLLWEDIKPKQDIYDYITSGKSLDDIRNFKFSKEWNELNEQDLISEDLFKRLSAINDEFERVQAESACELVAKKLKMHPLHVKAYKAYKIKNTKEKGISNGNVTTFTGQELQLKCGDWIANDYGVIRKKINLQNGTLTVEVASPIPIMPVEILQNIDSNTEKIKLAFYKNGWKKITCERFTTASSNKIIELANIGIEVNSENSKLLVKYIADCVSLNLDTLPSYKAISRLGWLEDEFMPYDSTIKFDGEKENKFLFEAVCQAGSYEKWIKFMKPLRKNIFFRLIMAASYASPLIEKVNGLPFVFHLWGGTGAGKTVGLMAAMSIWGNPRMGKMVRTMDMTANSMMSTSAFLCNLPFAGDELQTIKSRWENYDKLIMKITEGIDRGRMTYDKNNETKAWKCSFLFSGEEPCTKSSSGGGTKNRVIEIECNEKVVENGNEVVNFITENYGYAGIEYINGIRKEKDLQKQYTEIFNGIMQISSTTEKQAMTMALILLADKLAVKYISKDDEDLTIFDVIEFLNSAKEIDIAERAYDFVINFVAKNIGRFEKSNIVEVWGRIESNDVLINKNVLCGELLAEGFEFEAVKNKWFEKGYLVKSATNRFYHQTKCFGIRANYIKLKQKDEDVDEI